MKATTFTPQIQSNWFLPRQKIEESCPKCLYIAKTAHELKNIFISISSFIQNNIDNSIKNSSIFQQNKISEKESNVFLLHLCQFGMYLIHDINTIASKNNIINAYKNSEKIPEYSLLNTLNFCLKIFQYRQKFEERNITVTSSISISLDKKIKCISEIRLRQVIINLLSNSYKFTKESGVIKLSCYNIQNNKIRVKISDTGIGFNETDLNNWFKPFHVIERNQGMNKNGSGLGLSIVKEILESFNIKIGYSSDKTAGGSEFWFDLNDECKEVVIIDPNENISDSLKNIMLDINEGNCDDCYHNWVKDKQSVIRSSDWFDWNHYKTTTNNPWNKSREKGSMNKSNKKWNDKTENEKQTLSNIQDNINEEDPAWNNIKTTKDVQKKAMGISQNSQNNSDNAVSSSSVKAFNFWAATEVILPNVYEWQKMKRKKEEKKHTKAIDDFDSWSKITHNPLHNKIQKIIVCDDQIFYCDMIKNQITKLYKNNLKLDKAPEIYLTKNSLECLYWAYQNYTKCSPINIIIIDENLGSFLKGSEVCLLMKGLKELSDIKIFLMSAGIIHANNILADGIFEKPLNINNIMTILAT